MTQPSFNHPNPRFFGFYQPFELPIKDGDSVVIPKGTPVRHRNKVTVSKRAQTVRVHHVLPGMSRPAYDAHRYENMDIPAGLEDHLLIPVSNPTIVWAGAGGYWSEVDINFLPVANPQPLPGNVRSTYYALAVALHSLQRTVPELRRFYANKFLGMGAAPSGIVISAIVDGIRNIRHDADADTAAACDLVLDAVREAA